MKIKESDLRQLILSEVQKTLAESAEKMVSDVYYSAKFKSNFGGDENDGYITKPLNDYRFLDELTTENTNFRMGFGYFSNNPDPYERSGIDRFYNFLETHFGKPYVSKVDDRTFVVKNVFSKASGSEGKLIIKVIEIKDRNSF